VKQTPVEQRVAQESEDDPLAWEKTLKEGRLFSTDGEEWSTAPANGASSVEQRLAEARCGGEEGKLRKCRP